MSFLFSNSFSIHLSFPCLYFIFSFLFTNLGVSSTGSTQLAASSNNRGSSTDVRAKISKDFPSTKKNNAEDDEEDDDFDPSKLQGMHISEEGGDMF